MCPLNEQYRGDRKRKRPKMPQFPSDNKGSGAKRFGRLRVGQKSCQAEIHVKKPSFSE